MLAGCLAIASCGTNRDADADTGVVETSAFQDVRDSAHISTTVDTSAGIYDALYHPDGYVAGDYASSDYVAQVDSWPEAFEYDLVDAFIEDVYISYPGPPEIVFIAEWKSFPWSNTCSNVGASIPVAYASIWNAPKGSVPDWISMLTDGVRVERLSDGSEVTAVVTAKRLPTCSDGGCGDPATAQYDITFAPSNQLKDEWYQISLKSVPDSIATYITRNESLRFRPGHDARIGRIRYHSNASESNFGGFLLIFTEFMHSASVADLPTIRVAQGASSSLVCDVVVSEALWLGEGEPQLFIRQCDGLDVSKSFKVYVGGVLMAEDNSSLPTDGGEYRIDVLPTGWYPCGGSICNDIAVP